MKEIKQIPICFMHVKGCLMMAAFNIFDTTI